MPCPRRILLGILSCLDLHCARIPSLNSFVGLPSPLMAPSSIDATLSCASASMRCPHSQDGAEMNSQVGINACSGSQLNLPQCCLAKSHPMPREAGSKVAVNPVRVRRPCLAWHPRQGLSLSLWKQVNPFGLGTTAPPQWMVSLSLVTAPSWRGISDRVVGHTVLKLFREVGLMSWDLGSSRGHPGNGLQS